MNKKGFTLTEMIATMVILGIILLIAVPSYNNYIDKAKERKCEADKEAIFDAANTYIIQEGYNEYINVSALNLPSEYSHYPVDLRVWVKVTKDATTGISKYTFEFENDAVFNAECKN